MNKISQTELSHLDVIHIQGQDALKFLQGQCTADVNQLQVDKPLLGAFCTAKGRAISNIWLIATRNTQNEYFMICDKSAAPALYKHLSKYVPFFRGTKMIYQANAFVGIGLQGDNAFAQANVLTEQMSQVAVAPWGEGRAMLWFAAGNQPEGLSDMESAAIELWQIQDIKERKLWLGAEQVEQWIPQNVSLDELDGISFKKGCYTGQEVIARLHFKGKSKKRLFVVHSESTQPMSQIFSAQGVVGDVIQTAAADGHRYALAVLKEDGINDSLFGDEKQQLAIELLH